jgi:hypothetical protein
MQTPAAENSVASPYCPPRRLESPFQVGQSGQAHV